MTSIYQPGDLVRIGLGNAWGEVKFAGGDWAMVMPLTDWATTPMGQMRQVTNIESVITLHLRPPIGLNAQRILRMSEDGYADFGVDVLMDGAIMAIFGYVKESAAEPVVSESLIANISRRFDFERAQVFAALHALARGKRIGFTVAEGEDEWFSCVYVINYRGEQHE